MFHVVLFEPEIPPNTGNAIRLKATSVPLCILSNPSDSAGSTTRACNALGLTITIWRS